MWSDCLISRAWIGGPARSELDGYLAREGTGDRSAVAGVAAVNCVVCKHLVPPFLFYLDLFGMLLAATDMAGLATAGLTK
jgi:hypothetical protein